MARKLAIGEDTAKQYLVRVREKYANAGRAAPTKMELYYRAVEDGYLPASMTVATPAGMESGTPVLGARKH